MKSLLEAHTRHAVILDLMEFLFLPNPNGESPNPTFISQGKTYHLCTGVPIFSRWSCQLIIEFCLKQKFSFLVNLIINTIFNLITLFFYYNYADATESSHLNSSKTNSGHGFTSYMSFKWKKFKSLQSRIQGKDRKTPAFLCMLKCSPRNKVIYILKSNIHYKVICNKKLFLLF